LLWGEGVQSTIKSANACDLIVVLGIYVISDWDYSIAYFPILSKASLFLSMSPKWQ
jgi:hypothetical protein